MRKIIAIGESVLDTEFCGGKPTAAFVGGRIANAAASLGSTGLEVHAVSECATDEVGNLVVDYLNRHKVNTASIDRFTEGTTAFSVIFKDQDGATQSIVNYGRYPSDRFDVIWPRIDEGDIVLFGSFYAIDLQVRERLFELVSYARERKATIVYLPGFQHGINFRITYVMPNILENLEIADIVIAHERDINDIFPGENSEQAFRNHIEYYCGNYLHINSDLSLSKFSTGCRNDIANPGDTSRNMLGWQAGFTAGVIFELCRQDLNRDAIKSLDNDQWSEIATTAFDFARRCAASPVNSIDTGFAAACAQRLQAAQAERDQQQQ